MKILDKAVLGEVQGTRLVKLVVEAPLIARKARAGQFVSLMHSEKGERIPLTIVDKDVHSGSISLILQELGLTTKLLGRLEPGDSLYAIVGPLGHSTELKKYGNVALVGGGVGIAEIYPVAKALKEAGNHITSVLGVRTKNLLILEDELMSVSDTLEVATDDGSYGTKGFTTDILARLLKGSKIDFVYAVGPIPMMKRVSSITGDLNVKTVVSLNALMVDGTGMCGCCRVEVNKEVKFSCVDGPEFDAHLVNWDELTKRNSIYKDKEEHICRLEKL